jgi:hypothetical protein
MTNIDRRTTSMAGAAKTSIRDGLPFSLGTPHFVKDVRIHYVNR